MGIIGRQAIKSTIYVYFGVLIGFVLRAQLFPNFLTESQIGILALLVSYSSIYAQVALLGFNHGAIKYFPFFRDSKSGHQGFLLLYLLIALGGFLIFLVLQKVVFNLAYSSQDTAVFAQYYYLCIPMTLGLLAFMLFDNYNTILYNASTGVLLREFGLRVLMIIFFVPLMQQWMSFDQYAWLYVGSFIIIALLMMGFVGWRGELQLKPTPKLWEGKLLKAMALISGFGFITGLNNVLILQVNNILIDQYYDEALTGIYVTNFFFAALILMPSRGLNKIAPTIISDAFKNNDLKIIHGVQYKSTINQFMIALLIFMGLMINLDHVYEILPESFAIGMWVIVFTGIANLVQMLGGVSSAIIGFSNHYRYNTLLSVIQLVVLIAVNLIALPKWGITGAAVANLAAIVVLNVLKFLFLKQRFKIQPYSFKHVLIVIVALLCWGINALLPELSNLYLDILYRSLIFTLVYGILNYFLKISRDMNNTINKTLQKLRIW